MVTGMREGGVLRYWMPMYGAPLAVTMLLSPMYSSWQKTVRSKRSVSSRRGGQAAVRGAHGR